MSRLVVVVVMGVTGLTQLIAQTASICIEDGMSLRSEASKTSKLITTISLGEEVSWMGHTEKDSKTGQEYYDIKLSDGSTGWILTRAIATGAKAAVITKAAPTYLRPALLQATGQSIEPLAIIAVVDQQDNNKWIKVIRGALDNPAREPIWLTEYSVSFDKNDLGLALLMLRAVASPNDIAKRNAVALAQKDEIYKRSPLWNQWTPTIQFVSGEAVFLKQLTKALPSVDHQKSLNQLLNNAKMAVESHDWARLNQLWTTQARQSDAEQDAANVLGHISKAELGRVVSLEYLWWGCWEERKGRLATTVVCLIKLQDGSEKTVWWVLDPSTYIFQTCMIC